MTATRRIQSEKALEDKKLIESTLQKAVRKALFEHKRAGNPIAVWKEGRVEWIAPEDIKISEYE